MARSRSLRVCVGVAVFAILMSGCGGGGGGDGEVPIVDIEAQGRVALGALGGATVEVYRIGEYGVPVATTTTSTGASLGDIGLFAFSLQSVPLDEVFLLVVTGGQAFDADENGVLDPSPTANLGAVHGIASAAELESGAILLSAVTEVLYQRARYFLRARYPASYVLRIASSYAGFVLRTNLAGASAIDNDDALAFDPLLHTSALLRPYAGYGGLVSDLLAGNPLAEAAMGLSAQQLTYQDLTSGTRGLQVLGDLAYVCHSAEGLDIYDVSNPLTPALVGNYDTPGTAFAVQVVGSLAYVADWTGGLQIVDVSNPALPVMAGAVPTPGPVIDVHVVGTRAYLADNDISAPMLHVVDVSAPGSASILGSVPTAGQPYGVRAQGGLAYVIQTSELETIDVGNPAMPVSQGTVPTDSYATMDLAAGHLFVASGSGLEVFDLATPSSPQSVADIVLPGSYANDIRIVGSRALVSRGFDGLQIVDVQNPAAPFLVGTISTDGSVSHVARTGHLYVMTESNGGLITAGAGTPPPSGAVASLSFGSSVDAVDAVGSRAYVTTSNPRELRVLDVLDPLAPAQVGSVPLTMFAAEDLVVKGSLAFVAENGLQVFDVSNPASPIHLGGDTGLALRGLDVDTNVVYGSGSAGLTTYDVTTPSLPTALGSLSTPGTSRGVAYDDLAGAVVLCDGFPGIVTYDATTPSSPVQEGTYDTAQAIGVAVRSSFGYVTDFTGNGIDHGLHVIDYTTLNAPNSIRFVRLIGADEVSLQGDFAYVSAGTEGVQVVDISTPAAATYVATVPVHARIEDLDVEGGFVYVGSSYEAGRLFVLRAVQIPVP